VTMVAYCAVWNKTVLPSLMYFMLPTSVCILLKTNFHSSHYFWCYFIFLLLAFHKLLEPNRHSTFKADSSVHDSYIF